jgi:peptide/nickel transport system substrate-binding protein
VIPDEATRLVALKRGEVDIAYSIRGELAEELQRTPGLSLKPAVIQASFWLYFPDQWDPKSPWHDVRVRQAASLAVDRPSINQALTLGHSRITNSIIPSMFDPLLLAAAYSVSRACPPPPPPPNGSTAIHCDGSY